MKATCDAIEALHDDEMCSWYMGIDGKYPDDMAAIDLKTLARDYQAVCAERDELTKWRLALESLTPGGSEFVNDLPRCLEQIQRQRGREHQTAIDAVKEKRAVCAERDRLRAALEHYANEKNWTNYPKSLALVVVKNARGLGFGIAQAALQGEEGGSDEK